MATWKRVITDGADAGTPSALVLTNATALPAAQIVQGTMASGMVLVAPALGTPASGSIAATFLSGTIADARMPDLTGDVTTVAGAVATTIGALKVATGMIQNDAVTLAKLDGIPRGKLIVGNSSGNPTALAPGSANEVLTSDGTDIAWASAASGDIAGVTAGTGISGGGTSGTVTVTLDVTELTSGNADFVGGDDQIVYIDDGAQKKMLVEDVNLGAFKNDQSWTSNTGTTTASNTQTFTNKSIAYTQITGESWTTYAEPGIFSGGGTPTLASGVTAAEVRTLIGAGTSSATGDITAVTIVTDSGSGNKMSDVSGSADFSIVGATGCGVTNSGNTATVTAVPGEIGITNLSGYTAAAYANASSVGGSSIVTVGTIGTGSWNATAIPVGKGGTGATAKTGTGNNVLSASPTFSGTAAFPTGGVEIDGDVAITVESTIAVGKGGTGATATTGTGSNVLSASPTFTGTVNGAALTLSGNLIVNGTTTTINTATLTVEDENIILGIPASGATYGSDGIAQTAVNLGGISLYTDAGGTEADFAKINWNKTGYLSGWQAENTHKAAFAIAIMEFSSNSTEPDGDAAGIGSFHYDSGDDSLYVRTI